MQTKEAIQLLERLKEITKSMPDTMIAVLVNEHGSDPFIILISCLLSLRSRDVQTLPISRELFLLVRTPQQLIDLPLDVLEQIVYPIGFYRQKSATLKHVCTELIARFNGQVPSTEDELLSIKGVGRKTAALVLSEAFGVPAICVDVHVHRISNLLGMVKTRTPEETETALKKLLPQQYWRECNYLFVKLGQNTKPSEIINRIKKNRNA